MLLIILFSLNNLINFPEISTQFLRIKNKKSIKLYFFFSSSLRNNIKAENKSMKFLSRKKLNGFVIIRNKNYANEQFEARTLLFEHHNQAAPLFERKTNKCAEKSFNKTIKCFLYVLWECVPMKQKQ